MSDEDKKPDVQPSENADEKEPQQTDPNQAVEDADIGNEGGDDEKKEDKENPYEKQISELKEREEQLSKELFHKDDIIEKKNRAIQAQKKKQQELEAKKQELVDASENESKDEIREEISSLKKELQKTQERLLESEVDTVINSLTNDLKEQEAIRLHLRHSVQKTGDTKKDVLAAFGIANAGESLRMRNKQLDIETQEEELIGYLASSKRGKSNPIATDPVKRTAARFLEKIDPSAKKYL